MTNKELYRIFCKNTRDLPVFMTDWWMDAVCAGKEWDVLLSQDENGNIQAALPYLLRKRLWAKYIIMPQQTQTGGIWFRNDIAGDTSKVVTICQQFVQKLADLGLHYYYQQYPINSPAVDAMRKLKFKIKKRITYRIEDLTDMDLVINSFSKNKKRQLQKAQSLHANTSINAEEFYRFHRNCLQQQNKAISYSREFLIVLDRKARRMKQSQFISICDAENHTLAAAFLVWDKQSLYYLIPCYDPQYKDSGAGTRLVLEAMKIAQEKQLAFDFEGSMIKGVATHYQQFGSTAIDYYSVEKYYKWYFWLANAINRIRERKMH